MFSLPKGKYSPNFLEFFDWSCEKAKKNNKIIDVRDSKFIVFDGKCQGFCDGEQVVVARKSKNFELTYVHEVSHLDQAIENSPYWLLDNHWPKKFKIEDFENYFKIIQMERDCEIRSIKYGKNWKLFDIDDYARKANAYLFFYQFAFLRRRWIYFKNLFCKEILSEMPLKIVSEDQLKNIDMDLMMLYSKVYESKNRC